MPNYRTMFWMILKDENIARYSLLALVDCDTRENGTKDQESHLRQQERNFFSAASSWEIAIKYSLGKLLLPEAPDIFVSPRLIRDGITPLPIEHIHVLHVASLPWHHRDPFDRLLISQAQMHRMPILTVDRQLNAYDVELLWGDTE